ncbi:hypothetical protein QOT17_005911 [Balamuthia mandrillaris]
MAVSLQLSPNATCDVHTRSSSRIIWVLVARVKSSSAKARDGRNIVAVEVMARQHKGYSREVSALHKLHNLAGIPKLVQHGKTLSHSVIVTEPVGKPIEWFLSQTRELEPSWVYRIGASLVAILQSLNHFRFVTGPLARICASRRASTKHRHLRG